jgi:hypothetical protein
VLSTAGAGGYGDWKVDVGVNPEQTENEGVVGPVAFPFPVVVVVP